MTPRGASAECASASRGASAECASALRVVLADDARLFREALAELLEGNGCEIVAQVGNADGLRAAVAATRPDLAVIDIRMPPTHRLEGLQAAAHVRRAHPDVGVLLLSQYLEATHLVVLVGDIASGIGYLLKDRVSGADFLDAVRRVATGGCAFDPKGLCIPPILLGFGTTVSDTGGAGGKLVSWVDRRDFVQHVATLVLSVPGAAGLDIDRLTALLPHADPTGTRHLGAADVTVIEQATAAFLRQDFATGAGPVRDLAVAQLRAVLPLLDAQATPEVRSRLLVATAELAT